SGEPTSMPRSRTRLPYSTFVGSCCVYRFWPPSETGVVLTVAARPLTFWNRMSRGFGTTPSAKKKTPKRKPSSSRARVSSGMGNPMSQLLSPGARSGARRSELDNGNPPHLQIDRLDGRLVRGGGERRRLEADRDRVGDLPGQHWRARLVAE